MTANVPKDRRKAVYRRDGFACALCDSRTGLQIHHCIPRGKGGSNSVHNLITLCSTCHAQAHGDNLVQDGMTQEEIAQEITVYLADEYPGTWWPWRDGYDPARYGKR